MVEWTLMSLFGISIILFIVSIVKTTISSKAEVTRIDLAHISLLKEINELKDSVHKLELENEILLRESGIRLSPLEKQRKIEALDLYRRNYSLKGISEKLNIPVGHVEEILAPYMNESQERSLKAK